MSKNCSLYPRYKNKKTGELQESRLFLDLLSITQNRSKTVELYFKFINHKFTNTNKDKLTFDDLNQPTLSSIIKLTDITKSIPLEKIINGIGKRYGFNDLKGNKKSLENNIENRESLIQKAEEFNNSDWGDIFTAILNENEDKRIEIKLVNSENTNKKTFEDQKKSLTLYKKLSEKLKEWGVSIGAVTALEKSNGINGVTDFSKINDIVDGLSEVIRLSEDQKGIDSLPEELSHFVIEALNESPLVSRMLNSIVKNDLSKEILDSQYDAYNKQYEGNEYDLAKESLAKLMSASIKDDAKYPNFLIDLLSRLKNAVINFFKGKDVSSVNKVKEELLSDVKKFSKDVIDNKYNPSIKLNNIHTTQKFFNLEEKVDRQNALLSKIIDTELKRYKIYEHKATTKSKINQTSSTEDTFQEKQMKLIDELKESIYNTTQILGISNYLKNTLTTASKLSAKLHKINKSDASLQDKARTLLDIRNYYYSYVNILGEINAEFLYDIKHDDAQFTQEMKDTINSTYAILTDLYSDYNSVAKEVFKKAIEPIVGEGLIQEGNVVTTLNDLINSAPHDISVFDVWLDSAADSSSELIHVFDQMTKIAKNKARIKTIDDVKEIENIFYKAKKAGINDFDWMFEKDSEGNLTHYYIRDKNYANFKKAYKERAIQYKQELKDAGEDLGKKALATQSFYAWKAQHSRFDPTIGETIPSDLYLSKEYQNLMNDKTSLGAAKRQFYLEFLDMKNKLEQSIPEHKRDLYRAIGIRKNTIERIKESKSIKSGYDQAVSAIKESFMRMEDDTEFGIDDQDVIATMNLEDDDTAAEKDAEGNVIKEKEAKAITDFEGDRVNTLPLYFTKKLKNPNELSTDVIGTLMSYAAMTNEYEQLEEIVNLYEIGVNIVKEMDVQLTVGGKKLMEKFESLNRLYNKNVSKKGVESNIYTRLRMHRDMNLYGRYQEDEGTFGKSNIDVAKTANQLINLTSLNMIALNPLGGMANVMLGKIMMRTEAFAGEWFKYKNLVNADKLYSKEIAGCIADLGSRIKTNKLGLIIHQFDVLQDFDKEKYQNEFNRKTMASQMFKTETLYMFMNSGEHWMQTRTFLAYIDTIMAKDKNGKEVKLWDAFEVVHMDPKDKKSPAKIQIKEGYTLADGSAISEKYMYEVSRKVAKINQGMHGIYNKQDMAAIQSIALGRLVMLYRKWVKTSLNKRFKSRRFDRDLNEWQEGYYRTSWKIIKNLVSDIKTFKLEVSKFKSFDNLTKHEKANLRRMLLEVSHYVAILAGIWLLGMIDDDDKKDSYFYNMVNYMLLRMKREVGVLIPGKSMVEEGYNILKSPSAVLTPLQNMLNLLNLLYPGSYTTVMQSGNYKGHTEAYKYLMQSPLFPFEKTIMRAFEPEKAARWYK